MASNHTADPSVFYSVIEFLDASDVKSATALRAMLEALHDNSGYVHQRVQSLDLRAACALREKDTVFTDTNEAIAAVPIRAGENAPGPVLAVKTSQAAQAVYSSPVTEDYPGGSVPALTSVRGAAVGEDGRIVVTCQATPYNAFKVPGGSWTNGGAQVGNTMSAPAYSPAYAGFYSFTNTAAIWRSTTAATWTSASTGLSGSITGVAVIGGGPAAGRVVASNSGVPTAFAISINNGASFSASGGTFSFAADVTFAVSLQGCPLVSRLDLNLYVYVAAVCSGGASIKLARSQDGVTWEDGPVISAPAGGAFTSSARFLVCQETGLMVLAVETTVTADAHDFFTLYASTDFTTWTGVETGPGTFTTGSFAVASGRLFATLNDKLYASDGISNSVYTT